MSQPLYQPVAKSISTSSTWKRSPICSLMARRLKTPSIMRQDLITLLPSIAPSAELVESDDLPLQQYEPHQHLSHSALPVYTGFQSGRSCAPSADAVKHTNHQRSAETLCNRRMEIREKLAELHAAVQMNCQSKKAAP